MSFRTQGEGANHYTTDAVQLCIRYSTIETKEATRIGYNGFLVQNEFSCEDRGAINSTKKWIKIEILYSFQIYYLFKFRSHFDINTNIFMIHQ